MNRHTSTLGNITDNRISRYRVAASSQTNQHTGFTLYQNAMTGFVLLGVSVLLLDTLQHLGNIWRGSRLDGLFVMLNELGHNTINCNTAITNSRQHICIIIDIEAETDRIQPFIPQQILWLIAQALGLLFQHIPAPDNILFPLFFLEPGTNLGSSIRGGYNIQPIPTRPIIGLVGNNSYLIAVLQLVLQRYNLAINLGTYAVMSHLGVDAVGKINRHRTLRQVYNISIWSKDKYLIRENIHLQGFQILAGIIYLMLQIHHLPQPGNFLFVIIACSHAAACLLVFPMSSYTIFRDFVHSKGTNLNFQWIASGHNCGMEGLIAIGFWHGNIILEPPRNRLPHSVNYTQYSIAVLHIVHQHPYRRQIINFANILVIPLHFAVNAVKMLGSATNLRLNTTAYQLSVNLQNGIFNKALSFLSLLLYLFY